MRTTRRLFLGQGLMGLAVGGLTLRAEAQPTPASGSLDEYLGYFKGEDLESVPTRPEEKPPGKWVATEDNALGPFFRNGAPFRAKVTPPLEPGNVLLISGRVWGIDTKKPIPRVVIDIWQADAKGRYDMDVTKEGKVKENGPLKNRVRLLTDSTGYYEYETIKPGSYGRPSHIHYLVRVTGYERLITQLYFAGDPLNAKDQLVKKSLIVTPEKVNLKGNKSYEKATFDIVLVPRKDKK